MPVLLFSYLYIWMLFMCRKHAYEYFILVIYLVYDRSCRHILTIFCMILQLLAAITTGQWLENHMHGAYWDWCPPFRRQQPFCRRMSGGLSEGRGYIIPASIFWRSKSMTWLDVISTFVTETNSFDAPEFFWIFSAWTAMKCQVQLCVQPHSAHLVGVLRASCLTPTLYSRSGTQQMCGKGLLQHARTFWIGMDDSAIAAKNGYCCACHTTCLWHT